MDQKQKIEILQDVIRLKSENGNEEAVAIYYKDLLENYGIKSKLIEYSPGRSNLVAELNGTEPGKTLIISGHMDVVEAGDHANWTHPPYAGEIVDGRMYGRGTTDMKAGLTSLIIAMIELKETNITFKGTIRLLATVGEEIGMLGSKQLTEAGYVNDADGIIIGEPSGPDQIINSHKGSLQYEIIAKGKPAHSSKPENGVDALQLMVDYIQKSNQAFDKVLPLKTNQQLGKAINVNTVINGGDQINSVAGKVVMKANARTIPENDNQVVIDIIQDTIDQLNQEGRGQLELNILQNNYAVLSPVDNPLVQTIRHVAKREIPAVALSGATDASNFGRIDKSFDLAIFGPGALKLAHTVDEYVGVDEYLTFIDLYQKTYLHYLK